MNVNGRTHQRHDHKLRTFVASWIVNGQNATEAARSVCSPGRATSYLQSRGSRLLAEARAGGYLEKELDRARHVMGVDEVLEGLAEIARGNILDFVTLEPDGSFRFDLAKAKRAGKGHLIRRLRHDQAGAPDVQLYDAMSALTTLARIHGLFQDGPRAPPPERVHMDLSRLTLAELDVLHALMLKAHGGEDGRGEAIDVAAVPMLTDGANGRHGPGR